ncbi:cilia- and flagella-associated protein 68-like [Lineus longissimus]|uniref:cilia- and flagella-associated protein 68-like n=1 Tax=Lineus longissimus TaxID=88925 RepID=UPI002B4DDCDD
MSNVELEQDPPFRSMIRSSGLAEVWTHTHDEQKFTQFGWRSTTKDTSYSNNTLIGNWNEQRFDIAKQRQSKRLPSQYGHYFQTSYDASHNTQPYSPPEVLKHLKARQPHAFPHHQPELDHQSQKDEYNSFETTQRVSYADPKVRKQPLGAVEK